jgi:predicted acylesterase/phospholipase RssA
MMLRHSSRLPALAASILLVGCLPAPAGELKAKSAPQELQRKTFTAEEQAVAQIPGFENVRFYADSVDDFRRALPTVRGPWLALSAGGEDGAYGAGVVTGWSKSGQRPQFALVSGASTGALIATFAFLGSNYDGQLREAYTTINAADIFEMTPTQESLVDAWPLKRLVEKSVTAKMVQDLATVHREGRRLFVLTTNLDAGRPMVWDLGAIAEKGGDKALQLIRQVLLASSSIPGVFQPVLINVKGEGRTFQELHSDGSLASPFYVAPEALLTRPVSDLPASEIYVLINGKLYTDFDVSQRRVLSILGRSFSVALKAGERMQIQTIERWAHAGGVPVHVAAIDQGLKVDSRGSFDPDYMKALYAAGENEGSRGQAFADNALGAVRTNRAER